MKIVDEYINQYRPHLMTFGRKCEAQVERIVCRLDIIARNTRDDGFQDDRFERRHVGSAAAVDWFDIPTWGDVRLEYINVWNPVDAGVTRLLLNARTVTVVDATGRKGANESPGTIIQGGADLSIIAPANTEVYAVFSIRRRVTNDQPAIPGQRGEAVPEGRPDESTIRHSPAAV